MSGDQAVAEAPGEELAWLPAESTTLRKAEAGWQLEREIPRRVAAYFAREVK